MFTVNTSVWIDRSIEDVFDYVADLNRNHEWQADTIRSEYVSDGPIGVGSRAVTASKVMGREMEADLEVTAYNRPYEMCFATGSGPISFAGCNALEEQDGGTLISITAEIEAAGFFKVAEGVMKGQIQGNVERDMNNLKQVLEG